MYKDENIKLGFSAVIYRGVFDKTDDIVAVNDRLQKYCLSKNLLFVDNSSIDASCVTLFAVGSGWIPHPPPPDLLLFKKREKFIVSGSS